MIAVARALGDRVPSPPPVAQRLPKVEARLRMGDSFVLNMEREFLLKKGRSSGRQQSTAPAPTWLAPRRDHPHTRKDKSTFIAPRA